MGGEKEDAEEEEDDDDDEEEEEGEEEKEDEEKKHVETHVSCLTNGITPTTSPGFRHQKKKKM